MKIRSTKDQVLIVLGPKEALRLAKELVSCAIASGGKLEDKPTPTAETEE